MELLALFIVKKRGTVTKKIPVVNSLLNEDEGSSEKEIGRFQPIKVEYELVEYETARVRNDRNSLLQSSSLKLAGFSHASLYRREVCIGGDDSNSESS